MPTTPERRARWERRRAALEQIQQYAEELTYVIGFALDAADIEDEDLFTTHMVSLAEIEAPGDMDFEVTIDLEDTPSRNLVN